jgi:hypothetical protein
MNDGPAFELGYRAGNLLGLALCCMIPAAILGLLIWLIFKYQRRSQPSPIDGPAGLPPAYGGVAQHGVASAHGYEAPVYPGAMHLGSQTMSSAGGGGGAMHYFASADLPEQVRAFYRAHFGREPDNDGGWRWAGPTPESGRTLQVSPPSPLPYALPPGTQSVIFTTSYGR